MTRLAGPVIQGSEWFDKMSSTWIKFFFILTLVLLPYFVTETPAASIENLRETPNCTLYKSESDCTRTLIPVCADNRMTYYNACYFCIEKLKIPIKYKYHGICTRE
ncbi:serine protease inhibitor Kazal-type 11-like [Apodemus sylvaticus]|uniref:serine protease inhibitor Kazal-type 11-like n=1 Tax=Apodemus sylvaticus TaxID=10129 RepID=UPI002243E457|nr:serine protease inhibitor Kazal-type 11-like [Apodemus sylvaticus]